MTTEDTENTEEKEEEKPRHPDGCRQDERHENKKIEEAHGQEPLPFQGRQGRPAPSIDQKGEALGQKTGVIDNKVKQYPNDSGNRSNPCSL